MNFYIGFSPVLQLLCMTQICIQNIFYNYCLKNLLTFQFLFLNFPAFLFSFSIFHYHSNFIIGSSYFHLMYQSCIFFKAMYIVCLFATPYMYFMIQYALYFVYAFIFFIASLSIMLTTLCYNPNLNHIAQTLYYHVFLFSLINFTFIYPFVYTMIKLTFFQL